MYLNTTYTYDRAQRLSGVYENGVRQVSYTYDANGAISTVTWGNGLVTEYTRNLAGLPTLVVNRRSAVELSRFDTIYYLDGNVSRVWETMNGVSRVVRYTYDSARRLTLESDDLTGVTRQYTYDARGNRSRMMVTGTQVYTVDYQYDMNNRLTRETRTGSGADVTTYTYDRNGNQLTRVSGGVTETSTYNAWNQLIRVVSSGMTVDYRYRPDGLRLSKTVNGVLTTHVWDGMHIVLELNASRQVVNRFIRGRRLIRSDHHGWYVYNARGDVVQLVICSGVVLRTYRYTAFGIEIRITENGGVGSTDTNPFRFGGMYWDSHTQTYMTPNRHFNPRIGRWTQPDPFWGIHNMQRCAWSIVQAGNLYVFGINNPVMFIDPTGLFIQVARNSPNANAMLSSLQGMTQDTLSWSNSLCGNFLNLSITQSSSSSGSAGTELIRSLNSTGLAGLGVGIGFFNPLSASASSTITPRASLAGYFDILTTVSAPLRGSVSVSWWVTASGFIQFDFSNNNYWGIVWRGFSAALSREMFSVTRSINSNFLSGRTISGLQTDMDLHFAAYALDRAVGIVNLSRWDVFVARIGGTQRNMPGFDNNAWFFETANVIRQASGLMFNNSTTQRRLIDNMREHLFR